MLGLSIALVFIFVAYKPYRLSTLLAVILSIFTLTQLYSLIKYITRSNDKLIRFLSAIQHSDFVLKFSSDDRLGKTFGDLNSSFNNVLLAFQQERSEKEEHLVYIKTFVKHVSTGLVAINEKGEIEIINDIARALTGTSETQNISEIKEKDAALYEILSTLSTGHSALYKKGKNQQFSIQVTIIKTPQKKIRLFSFQNIHPELRKKELESWQNLTQILRHEIINSITPISSLSSTLIDILNEDSKKVDENYYLDAEAKEDIDEGLKTIANRTKGLISFVDAYRDYTNVPQPVFTRLNVVELIRSVVLLLKTEVENKNVKLSTHFSSKELHIAGDEEMLKLVFINLIKNAVEACAAQEQPQIEVKCIEQSDHVLILIRDNGTGIIPEAIDKIFIPFYTTKRTGSGIGLSLSQQIIQLHNSYISVESEPSEFTEFSINLPKNNEMIQSQ